MIRCVQAAEELIDYIGKHERQDPFSPSANHSANPWLGAKGGGGFSCTIL